MPGNVQALWPSWPQPDCSPHPPGCDCGCQAGSNLLQCWDEISRLKSIIRQIMDEVGGPIRTGPIRGVIDGSDAKPGQVGEWVTGTVNGSFGQSANPQSQTISPLVVPPGDWNLYASMILNFNLDGAGFYVTPMPTGLSNQIQGRAIMQPPSTFFGEMVIGSVARGSFSVPTLIPFLLECINNISTGGPYIFTLNARRMR